jgi:hypothetical protein
MPAGTLCPVLIQTVLDVNGNPISGALIYTYLSGGTTPATTYNNADLDVSHANSNPIVADTAGRFTCYLSPGASYNFVVKTSGGATLYGVDPVSTVPGASGNLDITGLAGEALSAGNVVYLSDGSASKTAGAWYKADNANGYSSTTGPIGMLTAAIASSATGTIRSAGQVTGLSVTTGLDYYVGTSGALTSTKPANARYVGRADTTSSLVIAQVVLPPRVAIYTATLANVLNTAAETTILSFIIPAASMSDGDVITVWLASLSKNNKGTDGTVTAKVNVGAGSQVTLVLPNSGTFTNNATERSAFGIACILQRVGSTVWVGGPGSTIGGSVSGSRTFGVFQDPANANPTPEGTSTPANFTADQTVSLKITLSAADATFYMKPQSAQVTHTKNG